jgi:hypothetical protein
MTREEFERRLAVLSARQDIETTRLVEDYRQDVSDLHVALLGIAEEDVVDSDRAHADRARSVLRQLAETAVPSLLTAAANQDEPSPWLLSSIADGIASAQAHVTGRLQLALADTRTISHPPNPRFTEEAIPPWRVCDEAYTCLRRILNPESFLQSLMENRHFLSMTEVERDREITAWSKTGAFTRFLEDVDDDADRSPI